MMYGPVTETCLKSVFIVSRSELALIAHIAGELADRRAAKGRYISEPRENERVSYIQIIS